MVIPSTVELCCQLRLGTQKSELYRSEHYMAQLSKRRDNDRLEEKFLRLMTRLTGKRVMVLGDANGGFGELDSVTFRSFNVEEGED